MTYATSESGLDLQHVVSTPVTTGCRIRPIHWGGRLCQTCGERRAQYMRRGVVKADRTHTLCFECFRAERNRFRARRLADAGGLAPFASPLPPASKMVGDRAGLFADLELRRRRAQIAARHEFESLGSGPRPDVSVSCAHTTPDMSNSGPDPLVLAS
jgi:hypothetical protein